MFCDFTSYTNVVQFLFRGYVVDGQHERAPKEWIKWICYKKYSLNALHSCSFSSTSVSLSCLEAMWWIINDDITFLRKFMMPCRAAAPYRCCLFFSPFFISFIKKNPYFYWNISLSTIIWSLLRMRNFQSVEV